MTEPVTLAHTYNPGGKVSVVGWWLSEKFDGVRTLYTHASNSNGWKVYSRKMNEFTIPGYMERQLDSIRGPDGKRLELDGELWAGYDSLTRMSGLARKIKVIDEEWVGVKFLVFDIRDPNMPFEQRLATLHAAIGKLKLPDIKIIEYKKVESLDFIDREIKAVEKKGGEGVMLRAPGTPYEFKRSRYLLKVKTWSSIDAMVIGYHPGEKRLNGMVGSLCIISDEMRNKDGDMILMYVGTGLNDEERVAPEETGNDESGWNSSVIDDYRSKYTDENGVKVPLPLLGSKITVKYKGIGKNGIPNFLTYIGLRDYE